MLKPGQALSVVYPKMTHYICMAEVLRDNYAKVNFSILSVKKVFLNVFSRVNMLKKKCIASKANFNYMGYLDGNS